MLANLTNTETRWRYATFFKVVMAYVFAFGHQFQITAAIVQRIAVFVMNNLVTFKQASKMFRHYQSMLGHISLSVRHWMLGFVNKHIAFVRNNSTAFPFMAHFAPFCDPFRVATQSRVRKPAKLPFPNTSRFNYRGLPATPAFTNTRRYFLWIWYIAAVVMRAQPRSMPLSKFGLIVLASLGGIRHFFATPALANVHR